MQDIDVDRILAQLFPCINEALQRAEHYRLKCYLQRRQWQLLQLRIGYRDDWSSDELIFVLRNRLKTLRKLQKLNPGAPGTLLLPMVRVAYQAEIEIANFNQAGKSGFR